jgi:arginine/ornithine N-succinyltransferase beta subunit
MLTASCLILPGCGTTVPVKMEWPAAIPNLMEPASNLTALPEDKKTLTDLIENANENFGKYYQLKEKYEAWQFWYLKQKEIYESIK